MQESVALDGGVEERPEQKSQFKAQGRNKPGMLLAVFPKAQLLGWDLMRLSTPSQLLPILLQASCSKLDMLSKTKKPSKEV